MHYNKIGLFYFHVASNIGDLAINEGVFSILKKMYPNASVECFILDGEKSPHLSSSVNHDVSFKFFSGRNSDAVFYSARPELFWDEVVGDLDLDLVVVNSGEHYFQYEHNENSYSLFWRLLPALAAIQKRLPVFLFPSTVGPLETDESVKLFKVFIENCARVYIRDADSYEYLRSTLNLSNDVFSKVKLAIDPAFFIKNDQHINELTKAPYPSGNSIALVMRLEDWGIRIKDKERKEKNRRHVDEGFLNSVSYSFSCSLIDDILLKTEKNVVLFAQTLADKKLSLKVHDKYLDTNRVFYYEPTSVHDYLEKLKLVDEVVASRFHALIMGMVVGKFPHGVYFKDHGRKMPGLFSLLGVEGYCSQLSASNFKEVAADVFDNICMPKDKVLGVLLSDIDEIKKDFISDLDVLYSGYGLVDKSYSCFRDAMISVACGLAEKEISIENTKETEADLINDSSSATYYKNRLDTLVEYHATKIEQLYKVLDESKKDNYFLGQQLSELKKLSDKSLVSLDNKTFFLHDEQTLGLDFSLPEDRR